MNQAYPNSSKRPQIAPQLPPLKLSSSLVPSEGHAHGLGNDPAAKAVLELQTSAARGFAALEAVRQSRSPSVTPAQHLQHIDKAAAQLSDRLRKRVSETLERIGQRRAELQAEVTAAIVDEKAARTGGEIRQVLRSMNDEDRAQALQQALHDKDSELLAAVVDGAAIASGLTRKQQQAIAVGAAKALAPDQVRDLEALDKAEHLAKRIAVESFEARVDAAGSPQARQHFEQQAIAHDAAMLAFGEALDSAA